MSPRSTRRAGQRRSASRTQISGPIPAGSPTVIASVGRRVIASFAGSRSVRRLHIGACSVAKDLDLDIIRDADHALVPTQIDARLSESVQRLRWFSEDP